MRLLILVALLSGCHARFRAVAPSLTGVRAQAFTSVPPHVMLGQLRQPDLLTTAVNAYQGFQEERVAARLRDVVDVAGVNEVLVKGCAEALGDGPPFPYSDAPDAPATVQIEVVNYGLEVPEIGYRGTFNYDLRVRMYLDNGRQIYRSRIGCSSAAGAPPEIASALGVVNNVGQIGRMTDAQIQGAFEKVAEWCAWEVVRKLRRDAR